MLYTLNVFLDRPSLNFSRIVLCVQINLRKILPYRKYYILKNSFYSFPFLYLTIRIHCIFTNFAIERRNT